jgi:hypothetical protein
MTATDKDNKSGVNLVKFYSNAPGTVTVIGAFRNVARGHAIQSIDFRPATGQLYAVSTNKPGKKVQLYTVNLATAECTLVGSGFDLDGDHKFVTIDFNPVTDRIRLITAKGKPRDANNYRVNPNTGALEAEDTRLAFAGSSPRFGKTDYTVVGIAHSNNTAGATQTTLYGWDLFDDALLTIGGANGVPSPDGGLMFTLQTPSSSVAKSPGVDMDISGATGTLYVAHDDNSRHTDMGLYIRNKTTGVEAFVGDFPSRQQVADISVFNGPIPTLVDGMVAEDYVTLTGRVMTADGSGIRNATITVTGNSLKEPIVIVTGPFGYYTIGGLTPGETYVVTVGSQRFTFARPSRVISLLDSVEDADFTAAP